MHPLHISRIHLHIHYFHPFHQTFSSDEAEDLTRVSEVAELEAFVATEREVVWLEKEVLFLVFCGMSSSLMGSEEPE